MRDRDVVASNVLKYCVTQMEPDAKVIGVFTAAEVAALAASTMDQCPKCDAAAWVNIDCELCLVATALLAGEMP